jgi:hypothetical protein
MNSQEAFSGLIAGSAPGEAARAARAGGQV